MGYGFFLGMIMNLLKEFLHRNENRTIKALVIGDAMVDEYYSIKATRMSPEFPIPVMLSEQQNPNYSLPGGAANVAYQFKNFNAKAWLSSFVDNYARKVFADAGLLTGYCMQLPAYWDKEDEIVKDQYVPIKRRFYDGDFPTYRWDIELLKYGLSDDELSELIDKSHRLTMPDQWEEHFDVIVFSDYDKGVLRHEEHGNPFRRNLKKLKIPTIVDPKRHIAKWSGCTIFKPNSVEAQKLSKRSDWKGQCDFFVDMIACKSVVITQGGDGVVGISDGKYFQYEPKHKNHNPNSVIGAGDCFVAFLAMATAHGFTAPEAAEIAFEAGSLYVDKKHNEPITPLQIENRVDPYAAKLVEPEDLKDLPGLVMANGCFDLLHLGHIELLKFAKSKGDKLVVALNSDASIARIKGLMRPIVKLEDRKMVIAVLDVVDYVVHFDEDTPYELIEKIHPDVLVKGSEYSKDKVIGRDLVKEVCVFPMVAGLSTTGLATAFFAHQKSMDY